MGSKKVKKRRLKKGIFQTIFCLLSLAFIIGCFIFYGGRLIKYYKIYNPKTDSGESVQLISKIIAYKSFFSGNHCPYSVYETVFV